jgi:signal transduction histidine kinase
VEAHGGTVQETGTPGEGARFVIELPRYKDADAAPGSMFPFLMAQKC